LSLYRYIFVIVVMFFVLVGVVYLRRTENCEFYKFRTSQVRTIRLKQQLWQKQLQLENSISPAAVSKIVRENVEDKKD
jgi:hypothetical protein